MVISSKPLDSLTYCVGIIAFGKELVTAWVCEAMLVSVVVLSSAMIWVGNQDSVTRVWVDEDDRCVGAGAGSAGDGAVEDVIMTPDGCTAEAVVNGAWEGSGEIEGRADDDGAACDGGDADAVEDSAGGATEDDWAFVASDLPDDGAVNGAEEDMWLVFKVESLTLTDVEEGADGGGAEEDKGAALAVESVALSAVEEGDNDGGSKDDKDGVTSWEEGMTEKGALDVNGSSEEVEDGTGTSEIGLGIGINEEVEGGT